MTSRPNEISKFNIVRLGATGAIVLGIFYVLCWVGSFLPIGPATHRYLLLFANPPIAGLSLVTGIAWSVVFGAFMGALAAATYNALGRLSDD